MPTIRKRGPKWQAQVRRKGRKALSKTFLSKTAARTWAHCMEVALDASDVGHDEETLKGVSFQDLLERYCRDVVPLKRSAKVELGLLKRIIRDEPLVKLSLFDLSPSQVAEFRDGRLQSVKPSTVNRELGLLHHCLEVARKEWGVAAKENPVALIRKATGVGRRERRLREGELERLQNAAQRTRNKTLMPLMFFALETGMRQGELLSAYWHDVNIAGRTITIPVSKNGEPRTIPLTNAALDVLIRLKPKSHGCIFPATKSAMAQGWRRLVRRADIEDLRFHDLRHEAISRFFEYGLTVPEVASISGHKDHRVLLRYAHSQQQSVKEKLWAVLR